MLIRSSHGAHHVHDDLAEPTWATWVAFHKGSDKGSRRGDEREPLRRRQRLEDHQSCQPDRVGHDRVALGLCVVRHADDRLGRFGSASMTRSTSTPPGLGAIHSSSFDRCPRPTTLGHAVLRILFPTAHDTASQRPTTPRVAHRAELEETLHARGAQHPALGRGKAEAAWSVPTIVGSAMTRSSSRPRSVQPWAATTLCTHWVRSPKGSATQGDDRANPGNPSARQAAPVIQSATSAM